MDRLQILLTGTDLSYPLGLLAIRDTRVAQKLD